MHIEDVAADDNGLDLRYFQTLFFLSFFQHDFKDAKFSFSS